MLLNPRGTVSAVLFLFSNFALAASVQDVFTVKTSGGGACDLGTVQQWLDDSETLINAAAQGVAATDTDSRKYLETFFKIGPNDDAGDASSRISAVQSVINGGQPAGGKPWLYCSSDWLTQQGWADVANDKTTGQPRADGKNLSEIYGPTPVEEATLAPFWSVDLMDYVFDEPGDFCGVPSNLGGTQDTTKPGTVTLCVNNFNDPQFLSDIPAITQEKKSVSKLQVQSLTLFHELFHLCVGCAGTPDSGYRLSSVVRLSRSNAVTNPESYTFYALAYWLGQMYSDYTFATSRSMTRSTTPEGSPPPPRRSAKEWLKMYRPPPKRPSPGPGRFWVA